MRSFSRDGQRRMVVVHRLGWLAALLIVSLALASCGTPTATQPTRAVLPTAAPQPTAESDVYQSPLSQHSPLPTATAVPTAGTVPTATAAPADTAPPTTMPTPTPRLAPNAGQLVLLHTNDNWGETEPCG